MTEKELIEIYKKKLYNFINEKISEFNNQPKDNPNTLIQSYSSLDSEIKYKSNVLIEEVLKEFNIDKDTVVKQGFNVVSISSKLLLLSFNPQIIQFQRFRNHCRSVLEELYPEVAHYI